MSPTRQLSIHLTGLSKTFNVNCTKITVYCYDYNDAHRSNNGRVAHGSLQDVMRRAGLNPTDIEVKLLFNGVMGCPNFHLVMLKKS